MSFGLSDDMASGAYGGPTAQRANNGGPQPVPMATTENASSKRDLTSWWKTFSKRGAGKKEEDKSIYLTFLTYPPFVSASSPPEAHIHGICVLPKFAMQ